MIFSNGQYTTAHQSAAFGREIKTAQGGRTWAGGPCGGVSQTHSPGVALGWSRPTAGSWQVDVTLAASKEDSSWEQRPLLRGEGFLPVPVDAGPVSTER